MREPVFVRLLVHFFLEAILQFGADFRDFHTRTDQELATQEIVRALLIRQLSNDAAILAVLVPAETPVRDGFRTNVLKASKDRILLGDLENLPKNFDLNQPLVRPKNLARSARSGRFRHLWSRWL
jgi:hypothetical protein